MPCLFGRKFVFVGNMLEILKLLAPVSTLPYHTLSLPWKPAKIVLGLCESLHSQNEW